MRCLPVIVYPAPSTRIGYGYRVIVLVIKLSDVHAVDVMPITKLSAEFKAPTTQVEYVCMANRKQSRNNGVFSYYFNFHRCTISHLLLGSIFFFIGNHFLCAEKPRLFHFFPFVKYLFAEFYAEVKNIKTTPH